MSNDNSLGIKQPAHVTQAADDDKRQAPQVKARCSALHDRLSQHLPEISRLEQLSAAAHDRELDAKKALAVLCGSHMQYFIQSSAVDLGRSTSSLGKVRLPYCSIEPAVCKAEQHRTTQLHSK